jgi:SOS-response transcriptional repressor LexA
MLNSQAVLDCINDYCRTYGTAPSQRNLAKLAGLKSVSTAHHHCYRLAQQGLVDMQTGRPVPVWVKKLLAEIAQ